MPDWARLDSVYQYILAMAASSDDFKQRTLGPIHLLKYAYLADLAHAERRDGATFSGIEWRFFHFGPWSNQAFERIDPAVEAMSASTFRFASQYADDVTRYGLDAELAKQITERLDAELPFPVSNAISRAVAEHGSDTADLLRHVYLTKPMLAATPGDVLDFRTAIRVQAQQNESSGEPSKLSSSEKKRRAAILESARNEIKKRLAIASAKRVEPVPAPRFDQVFYDGTAELDRLAGEAPQPHSGHIEVDDSMWESPFRRDPEIP